MANLARRSESYSTPAPTGGLNDKDSIAGMPPTDAIVMENLFPGTNSVDIRGGSVQHITAFPANGETLLPYNGRTTAKLFAASNGNIYDVSAAGSLPAATATGFANNRWDSINFGGVSGAFLVAVNGQNLPQFYDGTTWTASGVGFATAITGVTASTFSQVNVWKNRLFFVENGTMKAWYLPTQAIGGAANAIDFSGVAKLGGKLIATATVSSSAGQQLDDYFVAITSEGECLVYQGTDPAAAATFSLVGNYRIGRPIANGSDNQGGRFLSRISSQIIAVTVNGFVNLQDAINSDVVAQRLTINDKIVNSVNTDANMYRSNFGWQAVLMPIKNRFFVNVPVSTGQIAHQWVMNTITGAWTKYTGWNATCFAYWQDNLYAFIGTTLYRVEVDQSNDFVTTSFTGTPILAELETAFTYLDYSGNKSLKMVRPLFYASANIQAGVAVNVDFQSIQQPATPNVTTSLSSKWGIAKWGIAKWGGQKTYSAVWKSVAGIGYSVSLRMTLNCNAMTCQFQAWDVIYEKGGYI